MGDFTVSNIVIAGIVLILAIICAVILIHPVGNAAMPDITTIDDEAYHNCVRTNESACYNCTTKFECVDCFRHVQDECEISIRSERGRRE